MAQFNSILTNIGLAKISNAIALGRTITLTQMALGDGNGTAVTPTQDQTALVREVYRAPLSSLDTDPENPAYVIAELVVPHDQGGWHVREVGVFDDENELIAIANFPDTYKPVALEGSARDLIVRLYIEVGNAENIQLKVDGHQVIATRRWANDSFAKKADLASPSGAAMVGYGSGNVGDALSGLDGRIKGVNVFPTETNRDLQVGDIVPAGTKVVRINGVLFWLRENLLADSEVDYIDETAMRVYFTSGGNSAYHFLHGMHKQFALISDGSYFQLWNTVTNKAVIRWSDGSNPSQSHVYNIPIEVRADGHSLISGASTRNGSTDILFRTNLHSDYFYVVGRSEYQNEALILSHDTRPARADGSRKDGTGGGGQLPPEQDRYVFDDSVVIPSNTSGSRTDKSKQIRFPSLYTLFEQGLGVMRRTTGVNLYQWWHGNSNITSKIECTTSDKELILLTPKSTVVGGTVFPSSSRDRLETPLVSSHSEEHAGARTRFSYSDYVASVTSATPYAINLIGPGIIKLVRISINIYRDTLVPYYWIGDFQFTGSEVVSIGTPVTNLPSTVVVSAVVNEAGGMEFRVTPTSGVYRVSIAYDIN